MSTNSVNSDLYPISKYSLHSGQPPTTQVGRFNSTDSWHQNLNEAQCYKAKLTVFKIILNAVYYPPHR